MRVGYHQGVYDYHWMLQCSNGGWCEKHGQTASNYVGMINPSNHSWNLGSYQNFYDSNTVYLAVRI